MPNATESASQNHSPFHGLLSARVVVAAAAIAVVLMVAFGHNAIKNQLNAWKVLPEPERLTQLYFTTPNNLPSTYTPGKSQAVSFTIDNLEYRTTSYSYTITQTSSTNSASQILGSGKAVLLQNQSDPLKVPITPANFGNNSKLEVKVSFDGIAFGADRPSLESENISYYVNVAEPSS